jgi:hypothetical protein
MLNFNDRAVALPCQCLFQTNSNLIGQVLMDMMQTNGAFTIDLLNHNVDLVQKGI